MLYLNYIQELIKTAVDAIKGVTDVLPDSGALTSIAQESTLGTPTDTDIATDLVNIKAVVDGIGGLGLARKTVTFSNTAGGVISLFTVTESVKVKLIARIKTSCAAAGGCNIKLGVVDNDDVFIADTDLTLLAAGKIWNDITPTTNIEKYYDAVFEYVIGDGADIIATISAQADSGVIEFFVEYTPISSDGSVVAA